jgi:glycosyltransferase involved in cell wall biosynthesis
LASLAALEGPDPEMIVVDNTQGDSETEGVAQEAGATYIIERRVGLSRARNTGIEASTRELVAFIDDDAVADEGWLARHSEVLSDASVMGSTGRILPIATDNGLGWLDLGERSFVVDRQDPWWFERANFGGVGSGGSNMVLKRQAFENGLRFRESLGLGTHLGGFEEHYLFFAMIRDGARIAYVPRAVVRHGDANPLGAGGDWSAHAHRHNAAYLTMLLVEEPKYRRRTARYIAKSFRRQPLPWRREPPPSRLKMLVDGYRGPLLYLRGRAKR